MSLIRAKITDKSDSSGRWLYSWEEQAAKLDDGDDETPPTARKGDPDNNPAVEINDAEVGADTIVWLQERGFVAGQMWYEFSVPPPSLPTDASSAAASYSISANNVYENASASLGSLTLPAAGTYLLYGLIGAEAYATLPSSAFTDTHIAVDVYDATAAASVPGTAFAVLCVRVANKTEVAYGAFVTVYTVTGPSTLYWRGVRSGASGTTWTVANIGQASTGAGTGAPRLGYAKIG